MNYQERMDYNMKEGNSNRGPNNKQNKKGYNKNNQNIQNDKINNNNQKNYPYFRMNRKYRNYQKMVTKNSTKIIHQIIAKKTKKIISI